MRLVRDPIPEMCTPSCLQVNETVRSAILSASWRGNPNVSVRSFLVYVHERQLRRQDEIRSSQTISGLMGFLATPGPSRALVLFRLGNPSFEVPT